MHELITELHTRILEIVTHIDISISNHSAKNFVERDTFVDAMLDIRRLAVLIRDDCETATPALV